MEVIRDDFSCNDPLEDFRDEIGEFDKLKKAIDCPHCRQKIYTPVFISEQDKEIVHNLINYLETAIHEHPEVSRALLEDLTESLKELRERHNTEE